MLAIDIASAIVMALGLGLLVVEIIRVVGNPPPPPPWA